MTAILEPRVDPEPTPRPAAPPADTTSPPAAAVPVPAVPVPAAPVAAEPVAVRVDPVAVRRESAALRRALATERAARPAEPVVVEPVRTGLSAQRIRITGALMIALYVLAVGVQPAADGPDPVRPLWASALDTVSTFSLLALFVGTLAARRWAVWSGLAAAVAGFALSVSCPLSGHHDYAAWWGVQLAALAAMIVVPLVALRRQSR